MSHSLEYDLTVFGSFSFDLIETASGEKVECAGGSGNYFSLSAYLAGASVVPVGYFSNRIGENILEKIERKLPLVYLKRDGDISFHIRYDENWNDHYLKDIDRDIEIFDVTNGDGFFTGVNKQSRYFVRDIAFRHRLLSFLFGVFTELHFEGFNFFIFLGEVSLYDCVVDKYCVVEVSAFNLQYFAVF